MTQLQSKIYFVSDVHLGAPALKNNAERERLFVGWLDSIKADAKALFLMGDIFDFWFEYRKVAPRGFTRTLGKIAEIADTGIPVHFFTGNHDMWITDYLPEELGIILHRKEFRTELFGKKFFLAHGDGLDPFDKGYHLLKKLFTSRTLQWFFSRLHPNFAFRIAQNWSKHSRISNGIQADGYQGDDREGLFLFAQSLLKTEQIDYFVFGHRHLLVEKPIDNKSVFINLGDWINYFSYGVFDGEKFELKQYSIQS